MSNSNVHADDSRAWFGIPNGPLLKSAQKVTDRIDRQRPQRHTTQATSFRSGGRHHLVNPGGIIPFYPSGFVGIRSELIPERAM